jgi:hypothetical protein
MTSTTADSRLLVGGGIKLGLITVAGVAIFALLTRALSGPAEVIAQALVVFAGGSVAAYLPAVLVRPRDIDGIGWTCLLAIIGFGAFTVVDTLLLRPLNLYHWTWDAIGGGSGWWYLPVWFMGSAFLAWLGGLVHSVRAAREGDLPLVRLAGQTVAIAGILFLVLAVTVRFHGAIAALAFAVALVVQVPLAVAVSRR